MTPFVLTCEVGEDRSGHINNIESYCRFYFSKVTKDNLFHKMESLCGTKYHGYSSLFAFRFVKVEGMLGMLDKIVI